MSTAWAMSIALGMGLVGSLHCAGMCGPLAMALPSGRAKSMLLGRLLYNLGRISTYSLLGLAMGLLGYGIAATPAQRYLSLLSGLLILLLLLLLPAMERAGGGPLVRMAGWVRLRLGRYLGAGGSPGSLYMLGVINGLLPCGLVYAALAGALEGGSLLRGVGFMVAFGLGTVPMMLALSLAGHRLLRFRWARHSIRLTGVLVAALLILRGLNLGIPYLSPHFEQRLDSDLPYIECSPNCPMRSARGLGGESVPR